MCDQLQDASAQIDGLVSLDRHRRLDQFATDCIGAYPVSLIAQIGIATLNHRDSKFFVADEDGMVCLESRVAEDVVGMYMRVDDIKYWQVGHHAYGCTQLRFDLGGAAAIDHRHAFVAHK